MKKLLNLLILCALLGCEEELKIYRGDIYLKTQSEVNEFGAEGYESIIGTLEIGGQPEEPSDITDLSPLIDLKNVSHIFAIVYTSELTNLNGLQNLTKIEGFAYLQHNMALENLEHLSKLNRIGLSLSIYNNDQLPSLDGLDNISTLGGLLVSENDNLMNHCALESDLFTTEDFAYVNENNGFTPSLEDLRSGACVSQN